MTSRTEPPRRRRPYAPRATSEERRAQLLDAALALILREGYDKVSINAIAKEAGVTRPVVYGVFDGLGDLLTALLDRQEARALTQLAPLLATVPAEGAGPRALVPAMARSLADTVASDPDTWRPILLAPQGLPEVVRTRIDRDRDGVREHIGALIALLPGLAEGDTEVFSHAVVAILEHFGRLLLERPAEFSPDRLVSALDTAVAALLPGA